MFSLKVNQKVFFSKKFSKNFLTLTQGYSNQYSMRHLVEVSQIPVRREWSWVDECTQCSRKSEMRDVWPVLFWKVFWETDTVSQIFPTVPQNTVEPHFMTTTEMH